MGGVVLFDFQSDMAFCRHSALLLLIASVGADATCDLYLGIPFFVGHIFSGIEEGHGLILTYLIGVGKEDR